MAFHNVKNNEKRNSTIVTGALRAWSSGAGPMQFIKKLKKKEEATELGLRGGP